MSVEMIDLGAGGYPQLNFKDMPMPFMDSDVGKTFRMEAVVVLEDISPQGFGYSFRLKKVCFPEKEQDLDYASTRSEDRAKKMGMEKKVVVNIKA